MPKLGVMRKPSIMSHLIVVPASLALDHQTYDLETYLSARLVSDFSLMEVDHLVNFLTTNKMTSMSPIERLPTELHLCIFERLPDPYTLKQAALTSPRFFNTIANNEPSLSKKVVVNQVAQVDIGLLHDVLAVWGLSKIPRSEENKERLQSHLHRYFNYADPFLLDVCTLCDALELSELCGAAYQLAKRFARKTLEKQRSSSIGHTHTKATSNIIPSTNELRRISRAFLRINYHHFAFSPLWPRAFGINNIDYFFAQQAPWEIEQMVCALEYLIDEMRLGK